MRQPIELANATYTMPQASLQARVAAQHPIVQSGGTPGGVHSRQGKAAGLGRKWAITGKYD